MREKVPQVYLYGVAEGWYVVEYPMEINTGVTLYGGGTPRVHFVQNDDQAFKFDVLFGCNTLLSCPAEPGATSGSLTEWTFTDDQSLPGDNQWSSRNIAWPAQVYVKVYRLTSGRSCGAYELEVSR